MTSNAITNQQGTSNLFTNLNTTNNMKNDINGTSTCPIGQEQYERTRLPHNRRITAFQYDYRHTDGELFSCVKMTLAMCREARDKWLIEKLIKASITTDSDALYTDWIVDEEAHKEAYNREDYTPIATLIELAIREISDWQGVPKSITWKTKDFVEDHITCDGLFVNWTGNGGDVKAYLKEKPETAVYTPLARLMDDDGNTIERTGYALQVDGIFDFEGNQYPCGQGFDGTEYISQLMGEQVLRTDGEPLYRGNEPVVQDGVKFKQVKP